MTGPQRSVTADGVGATVTRRDGRRRIYFRRVVGIFDQLWRRCVGSSSFGFSESGTDWWALVFLGRPFVSLADADTADLLFERR